MDIDNLFDKPTEENFKKYIESGAYIDAKNDYENTPLHIAAYHNLADVVRILIDKGADIDVKNYYGYTPLHFAISNHVVDVAQLLIDKGADIDVKNKDGDTPLHLAIKRNLEDITRLLIDKGVDINAKNHIGDTPLHYAIFYKLAGISRLLINHHADIDAKNYNKDTPLHIALRYNLVDIARLLIDKGADIDAKNNYERTPLHFAISNNLVDIALLLIEKGVDIHAKNNKGWIPSMIKYEREEYRNLLDNLIKFISKIIIRQKIDGKPRLRFRSISLGSSGTGRFYRYANTVKDLYIDELQDMASSLGCISVLTKRGYCKYIAERLEAYSCTYRCNRYRSVIGDTVILQNEVDFLHESIEEARELYILLDTNGRYYGFSRSDYQYLKKSKINPHSTSRLTEDQMSDIDSFFKKFDGIDCSIYDNLIVL